MRHQTVRHIYRELKQMRQARKGKERQGSKEANPVMQIRMIGNKSKWQGKAKNQESEPCKQVNSFHVCVSNHQVKAKIRKKCLYNQIQNTTHFIIYL